MIDWRHWHNEPYLIGGLILLGWLYAILSGPLRARLGGPAAYPVRRAVYFYSALVIFYLAVGSPLDQIGERFLLSAHMLQHQLLIYPAASLLLLGLTDWMVRPVTGQPALRTLLGFLTHPMVCALIYTLTYSLWHAPSLYDWALQNKVVHVVEHVMFFGGALFYWWPVLSPSREYPPAGPATQMVYQVGVVIAMTPVFAFIAFSNNVLYPTYEYAPRLFPNFDAADDQLLGAAMMKLIGMFVAFCAFAVSFYRWYYRTEVRPPDHPATPAKSIAAKG